MCVGGEFVESAPSACTPEEIDRLAAKATAVLASIGNGDAWVRQIRVFAAIWPADWIELAIPIIAGQLVESPGTKIGWARGVFQRWTESGGPPASLLPSASPRVNGHATAVAAKPKSERERKFAALWEASKDTGEDE